jgi:tetratricopeptide (TPR) repeat protein
MEGEEAPAALPGPASEDERDALRQLAEIHASRGDLDKAVKPLRKLMVDPGKDVPLLSLATEVFLGTGNYRESLAAARRALRHASPGRVDLKVAAVMAQYRLGQVEAAMEAAQGFLKEHPKDLDLLTALGTMEIEMGPAHPHYGESLEKALHLKPKHVPALYQAGRKAQLEGDYKDAELAFRKVLKLDPRHAKAHGQLGMALFHLRKEAPARKEFEAALEINPKDYNTWFNLGELHLSEAGREGKPRRIRELRAKAMTCYLKAVEWNPDHAEAHYRAGVLLNGNGQFKEAIRHLEAARKVDARHVPTLIQLAVAYENLKRPERAKAYLERAFELDPFDKIVQFKLKRMT